MSAKAKQKGRFQAEVHLGLLGMLCILLFMNFASNYVLFKSTTEYRSDMRQRFATAAREATRLISDRAMPELTEEDRVHLQSRYNLQAAFLLPTPLSLPPGAVQRVTDSIIASNVDFGRRTLLRQRLWEAELGNPVRGLEDEFYYVVPLPTESDRYRLVLSMQSRPLAYMEDARDQLLYVIASVGVLLAVLYLILSRFIISPFELIRKEAITAGRPMDERIDDVEAVVEEYRRVIQELREKEQELRRANDHIRARADSLEQYNEHLVTSITSGLISMNCQGEITAVNNAGCEILQLPEEHLLGRNMEYLVGQESSVSEIVREAVSTQSSQPFRECDLTTPSKNTRHVGVIASIVRDHNDQPLGISVLMNDLTEVNQLRRELEQKTRLSAMGEMAGGLAHQLRNSMGAISGYAKLIARRIHNGTAEPGSVTALSEEIHQAESLVSRFLNFVRPLDISVQDTNVADIVREVISAFQVRPDCSEIDFNCELTPGVIAPLDPLLIKQVLTNIVENAVLASDGHGDISVTLERAESDELLLSVTDHGHGISPDKLEQIFTPFYSSRPSGSGLGLALSSKIVDMHGGRIKVTSQPGQGSVFTVILPLSGQLLRQV